MDVDSVNMSLESAGDDSGVHPADSAHPTERFAHDDTSLPMGMTALPRFVNFLHKLPGNFISGQVEATRHLPELGNGSSYTVREHVRGAALGKRHVLKVFKKSISPGVADPFTEEELRSLLRQIKILSLR